MVRRKFLGGGVEQIFIINCERCLYKFDRLTCSKDFLGGGGEEEY